MRPIRARVRNTSITLKLGLIVASLLTVIACLLALVALSFSIAAGLRAFVAGEGLYSKGQKDAAYYLTRYVNTRAEQDYQKYAEAIAIPLGDQKARTELRKPDYDYAIAAQGFAQAGNDADDIPYMISVVLRFQDLESMQPLAELSAQVDMHLAELVKCGDEVRRAVVSADLSSERQAEFLQRIEQINTATSPLERAFSAKLGEGARKIRRLLAIAIILTVTVLLSGALWMSWRLARELRIGIFNLRKAAIKVAHGDLNHRVDVRSGDELGDLSIVFNDMIEHRREAEQELRAATEFREKIMQSVTNAIYVIDLEGRFVLVNHRMCLMTGYAESEMVGMMFDDLFPTERMVEHRKMFDGIVKEGIPVEHYETPLVRKDKQAIILSFSSVPFYKDGKIVGVVGAAEDVTERMMHATRLAQMANFDALTGLPNRNLLYDRITQALSRAPRMGTAVALIFMDVDGFKFINDSYGHGAGDELLKLVAHKLESFIRAEDTVARLGGDEFVIMLCDLENETDAFNVSDKILKSFTRPFSINGREMHVTVSIGVSFFPRDGQNYETLLKYADIAMYRAKEAGRNCMKFFTAEMASETEQRVELEAAMRAALAHGDFVLHYQPQVDLKTGEICSAEALMRWRGMMPPARFIPLAEETGLIMPIGEWALRSACQELKKWHEAGHPDFSVAVNISSHQFQRQGLVPLVRQVLSETGVPPACLHLELTEGVILQNSDAVIETLRELKAIGVLLALDDFGTGYSSLGYLRRFPIDILKIDQSFTCDLIVNPEATSIIRAILAMAQSLNMKTVAEGVETKEQLDFLMAHGCDVIQGYYLSHALPASEFSTLLTERRKLIPESTRAG